MTEHDRAGIARRLAKLPESIRAMFAAMLAERVLPSADAYLRGRNPSEARDLRDAVDVLWKASGGEGIGTDDLKAVLSRCEAVVEAAAEAESEESVYAENTGVVLAFGIRSPFFGDPEELGWAAQRAYDTVDYFAQTIDLEKNGPVDNARVLAHPVVQQEVRRQLEDLHVLELLAAKDGVRSTDVEQFREAARRQARAFLSPGVPGVPDRK